MRHLVIVESPTKAKTIRKFLGSDYTVLASMGHIRDLPQSAADVPADLKKTPKGQLGVDVDHDFEPLYIIPSGKKKTIDEIKRALKDADDLYLATDEDREGESISWHLLDVLKPKVPVHRTVFHEITKSAIEAAFTHPRPLDEDLVRAQEARRILDRLVGYSISPVLWRKISYGLSAGRVQSAALKAIVDRERSRLGFTKAGYWDLKAELEAQGTTFDATLQSVGGVAVASGKDFDEATGTIKPDKKVRLLTEADAKALVETVRTSTRWTVAGIQTKTVKKQSAAPFITSTLQQEANRKLGLSSKEAMRTAQSLYEHGYITYMRTDSTNLSKEAVQRIHEVITQRYGAEYLAHGNRHDAVAKGAQEAHEAIRPSLDFRAPHDTPLAGIERDLYELIWMRTIASQMAPSDQEQTTLSFTEQGATFTASGLRILFPGFLRAYTEGHDDPELALDERERLLPALKEGDTATCQTIEPVGHETKPPSRFTEAGLVQYMEKVGIGRPSTYASIVSTLLDRGYARKQQSALVPTFTGMIVTQYMERHFPIFVDARFTSRMEEDLDRIAEGKEQWIPYLKSFYFGETGLKHSIEQELHAEPDTETRRLMLPAVPNVEIRLGRFGTYVEGLHPKHGTPVKSTIPDTVAPADLTPETLAEFLGQQQQGPTSLGVDPVSGLNVYLRTGGFGPYVQLGEDPEEQGRGVKKPKRSSVPKDVPLNELGLEKALFLLSLPRLLGTHPTSNEEVRAGLGRFGPYVVHNGDFRSLKKEDSVWTITLERALELLAEEKKGRGRGADAGTAIGTHPKDGKPITLHNGKYGPYVKHDKVNATIPKDLQNTTLTIEQAVELLDARAGSKKPAAKKRAAPRKKAAPSA